MAVDRLWRGRLQRDGCRQAVEVVCSAMAVDRLWRGRLQRDGCRQVVERSSAA
jgi:hypothetical protein